MEIIQSAEAFKVVGNKLKFHCVKGVVRHNDSVYFGKWKHRRRSPVDLSELYDVKRVETDDRGPRVQPSWTIVSEQSCYIKTPSLLDYAGAPDLERRILREVETCEILRSHPHPHIASYYGCLETRGRVSGLCFKNYVATLAGKVNPQHLNKYAFLLSGRPLVEDAMKAQLGGILSGIQHLHSLGLVHNDITPANIMLEEDGTWVIIDFDSCRHMGEVLRDTGTKRTHGWHDPGVTVSFEKNDLDAYFELRTWLFGSSVDEFMFQ
ncbi:kinase-like domain-containing protein [Dichotomopilus funicola]|uniref:EKC/KEOPS complex subunit BUD32 n=1 Tax=Dichotomopilus funicola TaxID=1934379 RepID=A0AAN6ZJM6_9PEZI|nr:kinase-like domain-containing protein [Dichotomopilus funicola]